MSLRVTHTHLTNEQRVAVWGKQGRIAVLEVGSVCVCGGGGGGERIQEGYMVQAGSSTIYYS